MGSGKKDYVLSLFGIKSCGGATQRSREEMCTFVFFKNAVILRIKVAAVCQCPWLQKAPFFAAPSFKKIAYAS